MLPSPVRPPSPLLSSFQQSKTRRASLRTAGKVPAVRSPQVKGMASSWTSGKAPAGHCHISWQALMVRRLQFKDTCPASCRLDNFYSGAWARVGRRQVRRVPRPHQPTRQRQVQRNGLPFHSRLRIRHRRAAKYAKRPCLSGSLPFTAPQVRYP